MFRRIGLFFLLAQLVAHANPPTSGCRYLFLSTGKPALEIEAMGAELAKVKIDLELARQFVARRGSGLTVGSDGSVDGHPAKFVNTQLGGEHSGKNNEGLYFFNRAGSARVVKLFGRVAADESRLPLMIFMRALEGAALGEKFGAPKVYQFGVTSGGHYYLEMEQVFPGQNAGTLKDWFRGQGGSGGLKIVERNAEAFDKSIKKMTSLLVDTLANDTGPFDMDFMVTPGGEVRWIDPHHWRIQEWREPRTNNPRRGQFGSHFAAFLSEFSQKKPEAARKFVEHTVRSIKENTTMTAEEKQVLLEELFHPEHQTRQGTNPPLMVDAFERMGLFKEQFTRQPLSVVHALYALPR